MPSCVNCAPTTTPLVIEAEAPLVAAGSGTAQDPLKLSLGSDPSAFALTVRDSETINFTLSGTGSDADPYVISADTGSAFKLTDLADVDSDAPTDGQVPTWVGPTIGGAWKFLSPASSDLDEIDADIITSGTLAAARLPTGVPVDGGVIASQDWNSIQTAGTYRVFNSSMLHGPSGVYPYGTLLVLVSGNSITQAFFEHGLTTSSFSRNNLWFRTKWNASDFTPWAMAGRQDTNLYLENGDAMTAISGYPISYAHLTRSGNVVSWSCNITSAAALSNAGHADGNVSGFQIGTIPAAHVPPTTQAKIGTTTQGLSLDGYIEPVTGRIMISSLPSGIVDNTGKAITTSANYPICVGGTWIAKELTS